MKVSIILIASLYLAPLPLLLADSPPLLIVDDSANDKVMEEIEKINQQIAKLTTLRDKALMQASMAQHRGDRLQFLHGYSIEARRQWIRASKKRREAAHYQQEIDALNKKKEEIFLKASAAKSIEMEGMDG